MTICGRGDKEYELYWRNAGPKTAGTESRVNCKDGNRRPSISNQNAYAGCLVSDLRVGQTAGQRHSVSPSAKDHHVETAPDHVLKNNQ